MADELDGLLARVDDPALRADLRAHIDRIRAKRTFGLVFESHLPERVRLPEHPIRAGAKVVLREDSNSATYQVLRVRKRKASIRKVRHPDGSRLSTDEEAEAVDEDYGVDTLVVTADFGEPIYPGLRRLGSVDRGGEKPAHVVIKGENHHVLEALQFTHTGKVDCIYIDPPYNTGARDWKYDNNYVDDTDAYRHSKWLAFMERRLRLAKELLNPEESVLIVTIDEKEVHRLGLLIEQTFPDAYVEMATTVISAKGAYRRGHFSRVEEHIFFVSIGAAVIQPWLSNMLPSYTEEPAEEEEETDEAVADRIDEFERTPIEWLGLRRREPSSVRGARPNQFYAVFVSESDGTLHSIGEPIEDDVVRQSIEVSPGTVALWPLKPDGTEMLWGLTPDVLRRNWEKGYARVNWNSAKQKGTVQYLPGGTITRIESGAITVTGHGPDGSVEGYETPEITPGVTPKRVWHLPSHNAETGGTNVLSALVPGRRFPYPKSLYAVEDTLRFAVRDKPGALVLDFFGGSGTTAHAVARLNRQDGGRRQSIVVTNNEVSAKEAVRMTAAGLRTGDAEWEALGIFELITRPRIEAAITGVTYRGAPVRRKKYSFGDPFPMAEGFEENVEFVELTYLDPDEVELDLAFASIAPLLWLRAGATGPVLDQCFDSAGRRKPYAWTAQYGVLFNPDRWRGFVKKLPETATTAFVVTDSQATFAGVAAELPDHLDVVRLYENYLTTFRINEGNL